MSDQETSTGLDENLSLPKATVQKMINEMLPEDIICAKESRDLLIECCVEFIHLVASEANEICEKESKKTIAAEHIINALETLGFDNYLGEVKEIFKDHKRQQKDRDKKNSKLEKSGMSQEELLKSQEQLFAKAWQNYQANQK